MGASVEALARRIMVRVAMVDGELHASEVDRLRWNVGRLTGTTPSAQQVRDDVADVVGRAIPLPQLLDEARTTLDRRGRQTVMRAAYIIATADGQVPDAEDALLVEIARGLEISPDEYHALVSPMALARALAGS